MTLSIEFLKPQINSAFDWQLSQEINVKNALGDIIAKAEIEIITLNKHRDATASLAMLTADDHSDWTIPLNVYFQKQNLTSDLCELLQVKPDTKAKNHIMIEAFSVLPEFRKQGVARFLIENIAKEYPKAQSLNVLSMPMQQFVDANECESESDKKYYTQLHLENETITADELVKFFECIGFTLLSFDESDLSEPLPYKVLVASPKTIIKDNA